MEKPTEVIKDEKVAEKSNEEVNREIDHMCDLIAYVTGLCSTMVVWEAGKLVRSGIVIPVVLILLLIIVRLINNKIRKSRR